MLIKLTGGRIYDPANSVSGAVRDIYVEDGKIIAARPDARFVYVADDAFFPYSGHSEAALVDRIVPLMGTLIETHRPDLVVIACNTASTLVLPHLRARFAVPFVGTVPAIKPACAASVSKRVSVLGTEATISPMVLPA